MKTVANTDEEALSNALLEFRGNTFSTLTTVTEVKARKNPFGVIYKIARFNGSIGFQYKNSVSNQMEREGVEGEFTPQPRKWGKRIAGTPIVEHNGNLYLEIMPLKSLSHKYFMIDSGKIRFLTKAEVKPYLPESKAPSTQDMIQKKVLLRDYKVSGIRKITSGGITYKVG